MIFWPNLTFDLFIVFTKLAIKALGDFFYRGAVKIENVAIYVGNKFYFLWFFNTTCVSGQQKGSRWEKRDLK